MKNVFLKRPYACAGVDPAWMRILEKSCRNYARSHLNLSRWSEYDSQTQHDLLAELAAAVRSRRMPLPGYALLHPEDKPSPDEFERIYQWTRAERRRLVSLASAHSSASADADLAR
jgi:hypothetical protein